jgi:hypothetical protein
LTLHILPPDPKNAFAILPPLAHSCADPVDRSYLRDVQFASAVDAIWTLTEVLEREMPRLAQERRYDGVKDDQVKRLKEIEAGNALLRRAASDQTIDKMILA